jgi:hypothetical protein
MLNLLIDMFFCCCFHWMACDSKVNTSVIAMMSLFVFISYTSKLKQCVEKRKAVIYKHIHQRESIYSLGTEYSPE